MSKPIVLIVDDEAGVRESVRMVLKDAFEPVALETGDAAADWLVDHHAALMFLDIVMPGIDGLEMLEEVRARAPDLPVVMLTATKTVKTAVTAMKLGAFDYLTKPFDVDELRLVRDKATEDASLAARGRGAARTRSGGATSSTTSSANPRRCRPSSRRSSAVAPLKTTVLITGESGTGKELIAKAIHYDSPRARKPLVTLNCAAIPETLLESELFGHERGSFTDAHERKLGQFELAARGHALPRRDRRDGRRRCRRSCCACSSRASSCASAAASPCRVDVRIVAATNRDLPGRDRATAASAPTSTTG